MTQIKVMRVTFQGHKLWMFEDWRERKSSPLIPRSHVDETTERLHWRSFWPEEFSFGYAMSGADNEVWRRGKLIGRADEIVDGWPEEGV